MRPGRPVMSGTAACVIAAKASTEIAKVRRTLCGFCSSTGRNAVAAAFATTTSTRPSAAPIRSKTGATCSGSARSSRSASARTPSASISAIVRAAVVASLRYVMAQ